MAACTPSQRPKGLQTHNPHEPTVRQQTHSRQSGHTWRVCSCASCSDSCAIVQSTCFLSWRCRNLYLVAGTAMHLKGHLRLLQTRKF